jgi:hypothetical protein
LPANPPLDPSSERVVLSTSAPECDSVGGALVKLTVTWKWRNQADSVNVTQRASTWPAWRDQARQIYDPTITHTVFDVHLYVPADGVPGDSVELSAEVSQYRAGQWVAGDAAQQLPTIVIPDCAPNTSP